MVIRLPLFIGAQFLTSIMRGYLVSTYLAKAKIAFGQLGPKFGQDSPKN